MTPQYLEGVNDTFNASKLEIINYEPKVYGDNEYGLNIWKFDKVPYQIRCTLN